jgi:hypothetical protein
MCNPTEWKAFFLGLALLLALIGWGGGPPEDPSAQLAFPFYEERSYAP